MEESALFLNSDQDVPELMRFGREGAFQFCDSGMFGEEHIEVRIYFRFFEEKAGRQV